MDTGKWQPVRHGMGFAERDNGQINRMLLQYF